MKNCPLRILTMLLVLLFSTALLAGCGSTSPAAETAVPSSAEPTSSAQVEAGTVQVSTIDELLAALAPDTTVQLAPGTYNLTQASDYGEPVGGRYYTWESDGFSDSYGLRIQGADGLTLLGGEDVEIVTEPRTVDVLTFRGCNSLSLQQLTVGHTEEAEACDCGVIRLEDCENVSLTCCGLYGCGTVGINSLDVQQLSLTDCNIYHCSSSAVQLYRTSQFTMTGGAVYDLGSTESGSAWTVIYVSESDGVRMDQVAVYNNTLSTLVSGYDTEGLKLSNLSVYDNHISTLFDCGGTAELSNFTFESNIIGNWFSSSYDDNPLLLRLDGDLVHDDDLTALWGDQLASAGVGTQEVDPVQPDYSGTAEVHVTTADEFFTALAPNTTVYIDVPQLNLTDVSCYSDAVSGEEYDWNNPDVAESADPEAFFQPVYDGAELAIRNMPNLHIVSTLDSGAEIVTEPRYAYVLRFYSCNNLTFENITLGHTTEPGYCTGGVLYLNNCTDSVLQSCDFYGCGIYGIEAVGCDNLHVQETRIHDCTYGAVQFFYSSNIAFIGSAITSCPSPQITLEDCNGFTYDGVLMDATCAFDMDADAVG